MARVDPLNFLCDRRRAAVAIVDAAALIAAVGFAAVSADAGDIYNTRVRGELQLVVDLAALDCASALTIGPEEAVARAAGYFDHIDAMSRSVAVKGADTRLGSWDSDSRTFTPLLGDDRAFADACRVTAVLSTKKGKAGPPFRKGGSRRTPTDVAASATARFGTAQAWDVMIVQDISGSFTGALEFAKEADHGLVQCLYDHTDGASSVGLVSFTGAAKLDALLQPLATGFDLIMQTLDELNSCCWWFCDGGLNCNTGTNISAGIDLAIDELVASPGTSVLGQAIVIVSDGRPQSTSWVPYTDAELREMAIESADAAADVGISVFTIYYAGSSSTPEEDAAFLETLVRGDGRYLETADADRLPSLTWKICASLPPVLVE